MEEKNYVIDVGMRMRRQFETKIISVMVSNEEHGGVVTQ